MRRASQITKETNITGRIQARAKDDKKNIELNKSKGNSEETMEQTSKVNKSEDVYDFKPAKESESTADTKTTETASTNDEPDAVNNTNVHGEEGNKRNFTEFFESQDENVNDDESKRKKRKEENVKETKSNAVQRGTGSNKTQANKQGSSNASKINSSAATKTVTTDKKSPCGSPKQSATVMSDAELDDSKSDLKVPPLKIVIPQSVSNEQETGNNRNGKSSYQRLHQALPYVVASLNSNEAGDKESTSDNAPQPENSNVKADDKKEGHTGNSSEEQVAPSNECDTSISSSSTTTTPSISVELHPRKRKMKQNKDSQSSIPNHEVPEPPAVSEVHPHEQPITNCYQLYLNIRKQIEKRRKGLFPVQPKPPQGFKDYLMNRCTYVLAGTSPSTPNITYPINLPTQMKDLFTEQEKERYKLRMQHVIEKEKLVLSVEQEILRVHGRAARALANQSLPFSVCTILRDEEVYNLITPEQEEKDRNARSRYNGRLFLSWLQDVDDKWEKIKEHMLLRHHNEAESLYAVQKMTWEWKLKELLLCDAKSTPQIEDLHVPMVHVSDDFDLLPA